MNRLDPNTLTAHECMAEIALILARGVVRRQEKLKSKNLRDYSLDLEATGSIHAGSPKEGNSQ